MAFQYGFAWQTFGVLREGKTNLCSQCQIHFGHLPKTPLENPNRNETLHFRKIDFCSMHQQFCMVASITNFSDKKRYLPSAALSFFCLTCGKIQLVSNCSFFDWICPRKYFNILQWAEGRQHFGMRDGKRRKFHKWKLDVTIPWAHASHYYYLHCFWADSFVHLWPRHIENAFLGEHLSHGLFYNLNITTLEASTTLSTGSLSKSSRPLLLFQYFSIHKTKHYFDTHISPIKLKLLFYFLWFFFFLFLTMLSMPSQILSQIFLSCWRQETLDWEPRFWVPLTELTWLCH